MIWCRLHKDVVDSGDLVQASQGRRIVDSCDLVQASQGRRIEDSSDLVQAHKEPLLHESEKGFTWTSVVESGWTEAGRQWF